MRVLLLPPDERPVHVRYPAMLAAIADAHVLLPPAELLPTGRTPADPVTLSVWLEDAAPAADVAVVSLDGLCHGGLLASRLTVDPVEEVVARLAVLRRLRARHPSLRLDASGFVTRLPDLDDATEEPPYWATHGRALAHLSRTLDLADRGEASNDEVATARAALPPDHVADMLRRRIRNHTFLLAALTLEADGTLDGLVVSSDDATPVGLPAREGRWLDAWLTALDLGDRTDRYAGADEVASVRTVRWLLPAGDAPSVALLGHDGLDRTAPYEPHPIRETARGQIRSIGARLMQNADTIDDAEVVLVVTPTEPEGDWALAPPGADADRDARQAAFADRVADLVDRGAWVAVADCWYANGGAPAFVARLAERGVLDRLGAYAGWNTAGNSIGSALAQAVIGRGRAGPGSAHERLLAHRLTEDVGYQAVVRTALRLARADEGRDPEPTAAELPALEAELATQLQAQLDGFAALGSRWRVAAGGVRLPWRRTFEVDLELIPANGAETGVDRG